MSDQLPTYSFLPWLRIGVANSITQQDLDANVKVRAALPLDLNFTGTQSGGGSVPQALHKDISLYGPGDIFGIDSKAVIKVEPRNWITNFEPNYLPYIDFYDEDFPWRYTPAAAQVASHRLRPWITLVVLKESEFKDGADIKNKPLPYFELEPGVSALDVFPLPSQLWAWAHVHVNKDLSANGDSSIPGVLDRLQSTLDANPDQAYSRIICPRRLEQNVGYHAFLIPTFETGRLAGLGLEIPGTTVATASAWANNQASFPYYYRWRFKTGTQGDFEYLVKLLKPKPADKRVGVRDMDVLHPGSNLPPINLPAELNGVLKLGGALRVPVATMKPADQAEVKKYDEWDEDTYPHFFEVAMADRINLADDYTLVEPSAINPDGDPDPVITSPLYGRWHALVNRLLKEPDGSDAANRRNWIHEMNLDPRFRVAAGFGTGVIQQNQEEYMNAAWEQVGDVIAANNQIRLAQLAMQVSFFYHQKHLVPLEAGRTFVMTAPMHKRVISEGVTVYSKVLSSTVPYAATSPPFRKLTRPGATVMKRLKLTGIGETAQIVTGINNGGLLSAPPKVAPEGATELSDAVEALMPNAPKFVIEALTKSPWLRFLPLIVAVILLLLIIILMPGALWLFLLLAVVILMFLLFLWLSYIYRRIRLANSIAEQNQTPESVDTLPTVPNFVISEPGIRFEPHRGNTDSDEAIRFKLALKDAYTYTTVQFPLPVKQTLDIEQIAGTTLDAIDPLKTVPKRTFDSVFIPIRVLEDLVESFVPVMAYPVFDYPMYKPLSDLSAELFLPNINLIPPNSMTLLESNQKFIESYMVGLNHEMSRELLWREYPTDQRGSYFRQFWDVMALLGAEDLSADERDKLRDIPKIHLWSKFSDLGEHNQREPEGDESQLVLVIRGELLKKYPTAVIYAQKAQWHEKDDGTLDASAERELVQMTPAEEESLPEDKIRKPLFEAKVDPDIYFLGFNLNAAEARGGTQADEDPGWFFVIKERPGEPRFGFDFVDGNTIPRLINWNNLTWNHVGTQEGKNIELNNTIEFVEYDEDQDQENTVNPDDEQASWSPSTNSAELAYILYQVPVLVAVHASRMLP